MKKSLFVILLSLLSVTAFAQLKSKTVEEAHGYKEVSKFLSMTSGGSYVIRYAQGNYVLCGQTDNKYEKRMATIVLGDSKESALQTLKDLKELNKTIGKQVLVVDGLEAETKLYMYMGALSFETKGVAGKSYAAYTLKMKQVEEDFANFNPEDSTETPKTEE